LVSGVLHPPSVSWWPLVSSVIEKSTHRARATGSNSSVQGSGPIHILGVRIGAGFKQKFGNRDVASHGGPCQCGSAVLLTRVHVHTLTDQPRYCSRIVTLHRPQDRVGRTAGQILAVQMK
jgi:hypothetical protein